MKYNQFFHYLTNANSEIQRLTDEERTLLISFGCITFARKNSTVLFEGNSLVKNRLESWSFNWDT